MKMEIRRQALIVDRHVTDHDEHVWSGPSEAYMCIVELLFMEFEALIKQWPSMRSPLQSIYQSAPLNSGVYSTCTTKARYLSRSGLVIPNLND